MFCRRLASLAILFLVSCASSAAPVFEHDNWRTLSSEYEWIETLRNAAPIPDPTASRSEQIEVVLENHRKLDPVVIPFMDRLERYLERTGDPRAVEIYAREKIILGDEYLTVLTRHDRAIEMYQSVLAVDPGNRHARARIAVAQERRYIDRSGFDRVENGMVEEEVQAELGLPREDWIRQKLEYHRVYAVWIYPKEQGGVAAVYFDNGVVYHKNWDAAQKEGR